MPRSEAGRLRLDQEVEAGANKGAATARHYVVCGVRVDGDRVACACGWDGSLGNF